MTKAGGEYRAVHGNARKGKKASPETRQRYSDRQKALWQDPVYAASQLTAMNAVMKSDEYRQSCMGREARGGGRGKGGIRPDLGHFVRSSWEANYARILQYLGIDYAFEPKKFIVQIDEKIKSSYTPDFYLPDFDLYIEIKGWWKPIYKDKYDKFREQNPEIVVNVIELDAYRKLKGTYFDLISDWEEDNVHRFKNVQG